MLMATTLGVKCAPVAAYTDKPWLDRELANIFKNYPLFMDLSCVVAEPGAYLTMEYSALPMLLVRGDDGAARVFVNVCRHRGDPVDNRVDQYVIYFDSYVPEPVTSDKAKKYWDKNIDLALCAVDGENMVIQQGASCCDGI